MNLRFGRIVFGAVVALALLLPAAAGAQTPIPTPFGLCPEGDLPHGARWKICVTRRRYKSAFEGLARNRRAFLHARIGPDALSGTDVAAR